jgi:hypothetical protein
MSRHRREQNRPSRASPRRARGRLQHSEDFVVSNVWPQIAHARVCIVLFGFCRASARHASEQNTGGRPAPLIVVEKLSPHRRQHDAIMRGRIMRSPHGKKLIVFRRSAFRRTRYASAF